MNISSDACWLYRYKCSAAHRVLTTTLSPRCPYFPDAETGSKRSGDLFRVTRLGRLPLLGVPRAWLQRSPGRWVFARVNPGPCITEGLWTWPSEPGYPSSKHLEGRSPSETPNVCDWACWIVRKPPEGLFKEEVSWRVCQSLILEHWAWSSESDFCLFDSSHWAFLG